MPFPWRTDVLPHQVHAYLERWWRDLRGGAISIQQHTEGVLQRASGGAQAEE